mgnify:FL=1
MDLSHGELLGAHSGEESSQCLIKARERRSQDNAWEHVMAASGAWKDRN